MSTTPALTTLRSQRASSDLLLIMISLLLSALFTRISQLLHLNSLLMQNQISALHASREARNNALETAPRPQSPLSCSAGSARIGAIKRSFFRCDYFTSIAPSAIPVVDYDLFFKNAIGCPARSAKNVAPVGWTRRSFYECTSLPLPVLPSMIVHGDINVPASLKMPVATENVIGARGSLALSELIIEADTTMVSLGDISIGSIATESKVPLRVFVLAPLGFVRIRGVQGAISVTVHTPNDQVALSIPRSSNPVPPVLHTLDNLPLGLFPYPLA